MGYGMIQPRVLNIFSHRLGLRRETKPAQAMSSITVDARERLLIDALVRKSIPHDVRALEVGDILCEGRWIAERKTAGDLARSIKSGHRSRLYEHTALKRRVRERKQNANSRTQ